MEPGVCGGGMSPGKIAIDNPAFGYSNIEAWARIISSYQELHPRHRVLLLYQGKPVRGQTYLFKLGKTVNLDGFELVVSAEDADFRHVAKLARLLVEAGGPEYAKFIVPELHRTLKLF